ncbi:MAG: hypothetical protein ACT4OS_06210 [Acidimicrobiales bacterium]
MSAHLPVAGVMGPPNARVQLFRWFEGEFSGLRAELRDLVNTVAQQQALVAEMSESRHAQARLGVVAESLPDSVAAAASAAVSSSLGTVGDAVAEVATSTRSATSHLEDFLTRVEAQGEERREDSELLDSALGAMRQSVGALEASIAQVSADLSRQMSEVNDSVIQEMAKLRFLKAALTRQVSGVEASAEARVAMVVEEALAAVDDARAAMGEDLDRLAQAQEEAHQEQMEAISDASATLTAQLALLVGAAGIPAERLPTSRRRPALTRKSDRRGGEPNAKPSPSTPVAGSTTAAPSTTTTSRAAPRKAASKAARAPAPPVVSAPPPQPAAPAKGPQSTTKRASRSSRSKPAASVQPAPKAYRSGSAASATLPIREVAPGPSAQPGAPFSNGTPSQDARPSEDSIPAAGRTVLFDGENLGPLASAGPPGDTDSPERFDWADSALIEPGPTGSGPDSQPA